ncbi:MAG: type II secretion system protein [Candidatus Udaeobacter sp.]
MRPLQTNKCGFTLIELLVVIAIIAILVGLLFPAFKAVQNQARQTQAKNDLTQIVNAVNAFYTEYGKYPVNSACTTTTDAAYSWDDPPATRCQYNDKVLNELRACTASDTTTCSGAATLNTRQIVFISPPLVKDPAHPRSGITTVPASAPQGTYYDPFGSPYNLVIDSSYDNYVPNPYGNNGAGVNPLPQGVIAWSNGIDQQLGTNSNGIYTNSDDVISWQ